MLLVMDEFSNEISEVGLSDLGDNIVRVSFIYCKRSLQYLSNTAPYGTHVLSLLSRHEPPLWDQPRRHHRHHRPHRH